MVFFRKIWCALFSCITRFEILPFALLPTIFQILSLELLNVSHPICVAYLLELVVLRTEKINFFEDASVRLLD